MVNNPYLKRKREWLPALHSVALSLLTFGLWLLLTAVSLAQAQANNGITSPAAGDVVAGVVVVTGTAQHPDYLRYELSFRNLSNPAVDWIVFAEGSQPVNNGALAIWDTTIGRDVGAAVFPDGRYQLRLRVVKTDYNYDEYFVSDLVIANEAPTPTPTVTGSETRPPTAATLAATAVSQPVGPLPSLTPFPTATPLPGPLVTPETAVISKETTDSGGGLFGQLAAIDTGRFGRAFILGIGMVGFIFGLFALYLLLRAIGRRLWQRFWAGRQ